MKWIRRLLAAAGVIAFVAFALYALGFITLSVADPRASGTAWDIERLASRDDVNVLFLLTDTLRADRLGCYGYERDTSPTFDYMALTGVRFARHLAQSSWTKCSMASLWTGLYPQRTGILRSSHAVPEEAVMPAEILREAGFRTAGIWRNGWVAPNFGFDQGFEVYGRPFPSKLAPHLRAENPHIKLEGTDSDSVDEAIEFLRLNGHERWFLYVHLMDVHQYLYDTENALFGTDYTDIYDNSIRHTDQIIGRLLTGLAETGQLERTLIVMTADHGEAFSERGIEGHAREVFKETTEVPFIMGFPFQIEGGLVVDARSRNVDIWPTIFDLLGIQEQSDLDGRSLVPEILASAVNRESDGDELAVAHLERGWARRDYPSRPAVSVVDGPFRYVLQKGVETPADPTRESLFDARTDPLEQQNVLSEHPDVAADLRAVAEDYLEESPPWGTDTLSVEIDEMEAGQLRALGYAVE